VFEDDAKVHGVCQKFRCQTCTVKGKNTYQIIYKITSYLLILVGFRAFFAGYLDMTKD